MADPVTGNGGAGPAAGAPEQGRTEQDGTTAAGADAPATVGDAVQSLHGDSSERVDVARAAEIISEMLRHRPEPGTGPLTVFTGAVSVGRDFAIGGDGYRGRPSAGEPVPVGAAHLADYTSCYLEPAGFEDAHTMLVRRHLALLAGPDGTGREAAALVLLTRLLGKDAAVFELPTGCLPADSGWSPADGAGYLATVLGPERPGAAVFDDGWLTRAETLLAEAGSYLVVVMSRVAGGLREATRRGDYVVDHLGPPDAHAIVEARLSAAGLGIAGDEAGRRMAAAGVAQLIADQPTPRFAVRVARVVGAALADGTDLDIALRSLTDPREQVRDWFDHQGEPEQVALAVAAAVLDGSSYLTVSDAAIELLEELSTVTGAPVRFLPRLADDHRWLRLVSPEAGTAEAVRFRNPRVGPEIIRYAWTEFDGWRAPFLGWLRGLVAHADIEVRARAAAAVGQIAGEDLGHARHRYLVPWARSRSGAVRQSAALALGVVGVDPRHTDTVWTLIRQWADEVRDGTGSLLPATAALALGGPLAVAEPARALQILRVLLADGSWALVLPAALSALQLIDEGRMKSVVDALMEWTEPDQGSELEVRGLLVFSFAVRQRGVDGAGPAGRGPVWPTLLVHAGLFREELPELWGRALDQPDVRDLALDALREWVRLVDEDWTAYGDALDLFAGIADRGDQDARRLLYHLERCADDDARPSKAAASMHAALLAADY